MTRCACRFHVECTVHDGHGKRWDAYTLGEIAAANRSTFVPAEEDWQCYCGRHEATDATLPVGTLCHWVQTSWECQEWECRCALSFRDEWLFAVTTDWAAEAHRADWHDRIDRVWRRLRGCFADLLVAVQRRWRA